MKEELMKLRPYDTVLLQRKTGTLICEVIEVTFQTVRLRVKERIGCTAFEPHDDFVIRDLHLEGAQIVLAPEVQQRPLIPASYRYSSPPQYLYMGQDPRYDSYEYDSYEDRDKDRILVVFRTGVPGKERVVVEDIRKKEIDPLDLHWDAFVKLHLAMNWAMRYGWSDQ